jgi:ATP-dependent DNA helicase RecG
MIQQANVHNLLADGEPTMQATPQAVKLLAFCQEPRSREEMQVHVGLKDREYFRKTILKPLLDQGLLKPTRQTE